LTLRNRSRKIAEQWRTRRKIPIAKKVLNGAMLGALHAVAGNVTRRYTLLFKKGDINWGRKVDCNLKCPSKDDAFHRKTFIKDEVRKKISNGLSTDDEQKKAPDLVPTQGRTPPRGKKGESFRPFQRRPPIINLMETRGITTR